MFTVRTFQVGLCMVKVLSDLMITVGDKTTFCADDIGL